MSISKEIEKLSELHDKGILNDTEFRVAKDKLLNTMGAEHNTGTGVNKIGNAAVSWVNLQWVSYAVGVVAVILVVIFIFIPHWQDMKKFDEDFKVRSEEFKERSKQFDKDFEKQKNEMEAFRKKNFPN
jgi:hypothetical protein